MAHAFTVTDGTTTFSLVATNCMLVNYPMAAPTNEGGAAANVTESISIMLYATTPALMQAAAATLERLLEQARRRRYSNIGPVVYVTAQLDSDAAAWRSRIYDARLELKDNSLAIWGNAKMEATLYIERAPYWEGALTQIPLTNGNGSANTSGLPVYNCNDGVGASPTKRHNYVEIAAADVTGSLPAPIKLEMTNTVGSAVQYTDLFAATNVFSDPANFVHMQEAETLIVSGSLSTLDTAQYSGGYYVENSIVGAGTLSIHAALSAAHLALCAGQDFHIIQRTVNFPAGYVKPSIYDAAGQVAIRNGDEVPVDVQRNIYDLGVLSLPPGGYSSAYGVLRMVLAWRVAASTIVQTDYWALFPTTGFRKLETITDVANGATVVDDGIEDRAYVRASSLELPYVIRKAGPVMVWPNRLQRVYLLWSDDKINTITQSMTVKAYYRPRRSTIG